MAEYIDQQQLPLMPDTKTVSNGDKKKDKAKIVKDVISKGKTITGSKPDEIIIDPVLEVKSLDQDFYDYVSESLITNIATVYDQFMEDEEEKLPKKINHSNSHFRDDGSAARVILYKHDTPGEPKSKLVVDDVNVAFESWMDDENPNPKEREAVNRHNQERKKIQLVPRDKKDRKEDDRPYRQQSIVKRIVDEARAKLKNEDFAINNASGVSIRGLGNLSGAGDTDDSDPYIDANIANADTRDNIMAGHIQTHADLHAPGMVSNAVKDGATPIQDEDNTQDKNSHASIPTRTSLSTINSNPDKQFKVSEDVVTEDKTSEKDPVKHLEDRLNTATDKSHNGIDKLMREVARDYNIDVHDLHNMWVKKCGCTPDEYVKENKK